jgi:hypothetical protein
MAATPFRLDFRVNHTGESPSGKAAAFGAAIRRFESSLPSHAPCVVGSHANRIAGITRLHHFHDRRHSPELEVRRSLGVNHPEVS